MKFILTLITVLALTNAFGQQLDIGVLRRYKVSNVLVSYHKGSYNIFGNSRRIFTMLPTESVQIKRSGTKLLVIRGVEELGLFDTVKIEESLPNHSFRIQGLGPKKLKERKYYNNLSITIEGKSEIKIINHVDISNYLGGVIESEGGGGRHRNYYKVQATLSRTYALSHLRKHESEGFNLCDQVHCQAYHNMLIYTPTIKKAVAETRQMVMVDKKINLANGFFFANCGGQTSEADFVWNRAVPYCKSVIDTFCIHTRQAKWEKRIPQADWENYLEKQFGYPIKDSVFNYLLYHFKQEHRLAFYQLPQLGIPLRDIRVHFKLRSTWFNCSLEGKEVVLKGKGFGHGVGLCQEGAMNMAKNNFSFKEIIQFYFRGVGLINYYDYLFFRQSNFFKYKPN
ncbi:MAG: SpoIID/LytB domain-containing protein [Crocinitomicaceae bacterium]